MLGGSAMAHFDVDAEVQRRHLQDRVIMTDIWRPTRS